MSGQPLYMANATIMRCVGVRRSISQSRALVARVVTRVVACDTGTMVLMIRATELLFLSLLADRRSLSRATMALAMSSVEDSRSLSDLSPFDRGVVEVPFSRRLSCCAPPCEDMPTA